MLSDEVLEKVSERIINRIEQGNTYILQTIGENIKKIGTLSPTKSQQLIQVMKYGGDYNKIVKRLSEITNLNTKDIQEIFKEVAKSDYRFAKQFYDYRNIKYIPYEENIALQTQVNAITRITQLNIAKMMDPKVLGFGYIDSITGAKTFKGLQKAYYDLIDEAVINVAQGKETFDKAMDRQIKQMGGSGLKVIYDSTYVDKNGVIKNRARRLDSAVRMNLKDGLRTLHNETQQIFGENFKSDGVEISVHLNPAPDHADMQGRQFSKDEYKKLQDNGIAKDYKGKIIDITTTSKSGIFHRPVSEYNCYHYIFSIVLGVSKPEYSEKQLQKIIDDNNKGFVIDGKHYTTYEGTQIQRRIETEIRKQKDIQIMAKASGQTRTVRDAQQKITQLTKKYRDISKEANIPTKMNRMKVSGYKRTST
jgi:hypothetical protein